jgi:carbamoyl-phosphate synthase large subunit
MNDLPAQTVLVTGAGGPAGVSVIVALKSAGHRVVAGDASAEAVGLRLGDHRAVLPRADDPGFAAALCAVAEQYGATAVIPTVAEELVALHALTPELSAAGLHHWLPDPVAVESCTDKWLFHQAARASGVPVPETALASTAGVPGPWVIKPRNGRGSRDVYLTDDEAEATSLLSRVPDALVQQRLAGQEFTVDALVDRDGTLVAAAPRWRHETKAGISVRGETFASPAVVAGVAQLLGGLGLRGPANVQGFLDPSPASAWADGLAFMEVNPRFSGGLPLTLAAGCDVVGQYLRGILGLPLQPDQLTFRPGVRMYRYFAEVFEDAQSE